MVIIAAATAAGAVMGMYGGLAPDRFEQILYSSLKLPVLLLGTFVLCLPGFLTVNVMLGVAGDFPQAMRAILRTQATISVVHLSFMPLVALWYLLVREHAWAVLVNATALGAASLAAQLVLRRDYRPLIDRNPVHRGLMWAWLVLYAFVGVQLAWVLRPYIGTPGMDTTFFREDSWSNAYLAVVGKARTALGL
jgi:hypothetical protein